MANEGLYIRTAEPAETAPLVSTDDAKAHLRVQHDDEDTLIAALVESAERHISDALAMPLRASTWFGYFRNPGNPNLGLWISGPVVSVSDVAIYDQDDTWTDLENPDYTARALPEGRGNACVEFTRDFWAKKYCRINWHDLHPLRVSFTRGYAAGKLPKSLEHAMKLLLAEWYEHREAASPFPRTELPLGVRRLLAPFTVRTL